MRLTRGEVAGAVFLLAVLACARIEAPPGGPKDVLPPRLIATVPESMAVLPRFDGDVEFIFNETVSEGGSPNMGLGTGDLEKLIILSPTDRVPKVRWERSRITVRPDEGWKPNRVYRVQLLAGVMDLRRNRTDSGRIVTLTTGAPIPTRHLTGQVWDWNTARPAARALVVAMLLPDSLRYRSLADSTGKFDIGPLPTGHYVVYGIIDQNRNVVFDPREAWDSASVSPDSSAVRELWTFPHDTVGPRLAKAAVQDSLSAVLTFNQALDPTQRFGAGAVRVLKLPDSVAVKVLSLLTKAEHDSLYRSPPAPVDSAKAHLAPVDSARPRAAQLPAPALDSIRPARAPLYTALTLRVGEAWVPGTTYVLEIDSVRNVNRAVADVRGPLEVPALKKDSTATDSTAKRPPAAPGKEFPGGKPSR